MDKNLSWFIGPKSENAKYFSELLEIITQDYFHWRKNYFPEDPLLLNKSDQRIFNSDNDNLYKNINEFLAALRRNFPFYNPRYIAHMLSDTTISGMLGYFGAMLYNPNNVTPEAAPVTTEWEIEACNEVSKMLGYKPSPKPPQKDGTLEDWEKYQKELRNEFGWSHITSGGTVANIEALWVARTVKYAPLAIQEVSINNDIQIEIKLPNSKAGIKDIKKIDKFELINIKPNESIYLLAKFIKAYHEKFSSLSIEDATKRAFEELDNAEYSLSNNLGKLLTEFPLAIFVSGTAHYSVRKAADILGIGRNNIVTIPIDPQFRANVKSLEQLLKKSLKNKISPLAVIGVVGTTEEGAIDPIDQIVQLREKLEIDQNISFWLHIDAAWGGFAKTVLNLSPQDEYEIIEKKIIDLLNIRHPNQNIKDIEIYEKFSREQISNYISEKENKFNDELNTALVFDDSIDITNCKSKHQLLKKELYTLIKEGGLINESSDLSNKIEILESLVSLSNEITKSRILLNEFVRLHDILNHDISNGDYENAITAVELFINHSETMILNSSIIEKNHFKVTLIDRVNDLALFTNEKIELQYKKYSKSKVINVGNTKEVVSAYLAFKYSDSITIDPHKLGYIPYPNGVIAFRNDRVRHFIKNDAPYITSSKHNALMHNPPMHIKNIDFNSITNDNLPYENYSVSIDAFAPFILEGSKPGASAASLWLSIKTIPLNRYAHGSIIKNTLMTARELYEWMISWKKILINVNEDSSYEFLPISPTYPDLNVFVFVIKVKNIASLECMNKLVETVYNKYSIQAEFGDKKYSYAQPFFLSKTPFTMPNYNFSAFKDFFDKNGIRNAQKTYKENGMIVLRATLMNPYIYAYKKEGKANLIKDFIINLHKISEESAKQILINSAQCK